MMEVRKGYTAYNLHKLDNPSNYSVRLFRTKKGAKMAIRWWKEGAFYNPNRSKYGGRQNLEKLETPERENVDLIIKEVILAT